MRRPAVLALIAGGVLAAALVAGCTSGGAKSSSGRVEDSVNGAVGAPAAGPIAEASPTSGAIHSSSGGAGTSAKLVADTGEVIRTAQMTVGVKDASAVAVQANKAEALVTARGGVVFGDDRNNPTSTDPTADDDATATLTLKVPPAQLTATLTALSQLGKEQSRSLSSQDVTTEVADVNARLESAAASIARLRTLYGSATKVSDVIEIESELSQREADLESLQAQQRALSSETQMATVTLVLTTMKAPVTKPHHHHYTGIGGAFARGWHAFGSAGGWLIAAIATVVPFAVLIALLVGAGLWARRRRPTPTPAPTPDAV